MDLRQSPQYADYLQLLGWKIGRIGSCQIFIRQFPLIGSIIKIQRPEKMPSLEQILQLAKRYRASQILIEPSKPLNHLTIQPFSDYGFRPSSPSLPSKTLHIDLTRNEDQIFSGFTPAKRRAIRRAIKNKVMIKESEDIESFIRLKNAQHGFLGRILKVDKQFHALWQAFRPQKTILLLAFDTFDTLGTLDTFIPVAGLLLLFHEKIAYYYQAVSTKQGNQLAAPSFLVWEALKLAKKKGCQTFDFEGIDDSRFSQKSWLGFTKFKKGFGGKEITYPPPLAKNSLQLVAR